jgi:predicted flap endonuclease-1-like 5' DNA nuclease
MANIDRIEGIGSSYATTLRAAGINSVESLLDAACEKASRSELAAKTGISEKLILKWVNMADLFRIRGVGSQYAELLECSGVDTVKELAQRNANSLHVAMARANNDKRVVRQVPSLRIVNSWITEAKTLPRKVSY